MFTYTSLDRDFFVDMNGIYFLSRLRNQKVPIKRKELKNRKIFSKILIFWNTKFRWHPISGNFLLHQENLLNFCYNV